MAKANYMARLVLLTTEWMVIIKTTTIPGQTLDLKVSCAPRHSLRRLYVSLWFYGQLSVCIRSSSVGLHYHVT